MVLEVVPRALEEQRVADRDGRLAHELLAPAPDREHDQVAAVGRHPREHRRADQARSRRHENLRQPGAPADQLGRVMAEGILVDQGLREVAEIAGHRLRLPGREQTLAQKDDDRDRPGEER